MTSRNLLTLSACALSLGLSAATLASAAPAAPQTSVACRMAPPPSPPHNVFRTVARIPRADGATAQAADCDCPIMMTDAAARAACMDTMAPPKG